MLKDEYGLQVSCDSDSAMEAYRAGIACSLRLDDSSIDAFAEAVSNDEDFALARAALGRHLSIHGYQDESLLEIEAALALSDRVTPRERSAIEITAAAIRSEPRAAALAESHVAAHPRDIFVLAQLLGPFGMLAFSGRRDWREKNVETLEATKPHYGDDDWWHLTTRGFFHAEQGNVTQAARDCERAWSLSENGNCAHSMAHMHFEAGVLDEGRAFIRDWARKYAARSTMRHHMMWHYSILEVESVAEMNEIMETYRNELDPAVNDPTPLETLADNASLMWRCHLAGGAIPAKLREGLRDYALSRYPACGFAFVDLHKAMATALCAGKVHENLVEELSETAHASQVARCVLHCARAFSAFVGGAYADTITDLEPVLADSFLLGGSNPQRRIVEDTYVEACIRAGQFDKARTILLNRNRPSSAYDRRLLARVEDGDCKTLW